MSKTPTTVQRYYGVGSGRFFTPDPSGHANPSDPQTWNQYSYTHGDPANRSDSTGLDDEGPAPTTCYVNGQQFTGAICEFYFSTHAPGSGPNPNPEYDPLTPRGVNVQRAFVPPPDPPYVALSPDAEAHMLDSAYDLAMRALGFADCAGLFNKGSVGFSPDELLALLISGRGSNLGSIEFGQIKNWAVSATTQNVDGTIIHELIHAVYDQYGPPAQWPARSGSAGSTRRERNANPTGCG